MDPRNLLLYLLALIIAGFGLATLKKDPAEVVRRRFSLICLGLILWLVGIATLRTVETEPWLNLGLYLTFLGPILVGAMFVLFAYAFPTPRPYPPALVPLLSLTSLLGLLIVFTPGLLILEVLGSGSDKVITYQPLGLALLGGLIGLEMLGGFSILLRKFLSARGLEQLQLSYFLLGSGLTFVISFTTNLFLPLIGEHRLGWLGPASTLIWVGFLGFSVYTTALFDLKFIIRRAVVYSILLGAVVSLYAFLIITLSGKLPVVGPYAAALLIGLSFGPIRRGLTRLTDRFLLLGDYKAHDVLGRLAAQLNEVVDLAGAITITLQELKATLRPSSIAAVVLERDGRSRLFGDLTGGQAVDLLLRRGGEGRRPVFVRGRDPRLLLPLWIGGRERSPLFLGLVILGERHSGAAYARYDLEFLQATSDLLSTAIERGRFYEEEVLKNEFISIASHDLMTPIAATKGYLSMLLDEGMGRLDPEATTYLTRIRRSVTYMQTLVIDLLNVSRIELGRVKIHLTPVTLAEVVSVVTEDLAPLAQDRRIRIAFGPLNKRVSADPDRLREVLTNVVGNAIKYNRPDGRVEIKAATIKGRVSLSIADTGVGIAEADQPHLGEKFYRAKNSSGVSGSGLGLYIVKEYTERMGGTMEVTSRVGKGTTVTLRFRPA